jgi:hypothetical protein
MKDYYKVTDEEIKDLTLKMFKEFRKNQIVRELERKHILKVYLEKTTELLTIEVLKKVYKEINELKEEFNNINQLKEVTLE